MNLKHSQRLRAAVMEPPRALLEYSGRGDARRVVGPLKDSNGSELAGVTALLDSPVIGVQQATVRIPVGVADGLVAGAVIEIEGDLGLRMNGADYGQVRVTVEGESGIREIGSLTTILDGVPRQGSKVAVS